jgi:predicted DNA-binding transcriptional regulator
MSKDQAIGGAILAVCVIIAIGYTILIIQPNWITGPLDMNITDNDARLYAVVIPVFIAFIAILLIGAWIGWTMATTPPPKPIEEITTEIEEKKEEIKAEESTASTAPEKKKKSDK